MAMISMTINIKLTNADAEKILNSQPSDTLKNLLKNIKKPKNTSAPNKLIAKYLEK